MRFRDLRMVHIKDAIYPEGHEPPTLTAEQLGGLPEPTPRRLSRYIGKSAVVRKRAIPLIFAEPIANRARRRANGLRRQRRRTVPLTQIDLPWKPRPDESDQND